MINRWKYLTPFDMFGDVKEALYRYAVSDSEWEAFQTIERNGHFRKAVSYSTSFLITNRAGGFNITVHSKTLEFVAIPVEWSCLPDATCEAVHNWLIRSQAYKAEYVTIRDRVASLTRLCTTPGQIERTWPELLGFMPGEVIDQRFIKKSLSPYPDGVWEDGWQTLHPKERVLKEAYRPETLAWFNDALTEALILPEQDWDELTPYPEVQLLK